MRKFRTCVIGMGFIGVVHVENLRRLGFVEVVAIADEINAQQKADQVCVPKGYVDYRAMLDTEKPDVVHICTPNSTHFAIAMYAMERGINVICEKPLTTSVEEAESLCAFAKEKGLVCSVNFNLRFNPQVMQMKEMVRRGDVGSIYTVHGSYLQDWLYLDTDYSWRLEPAVSGESRAFADIGSHWADMAETVTGQRAVEVLADFETFSIRSAKSPSSLWTRIRAWRCAPRIMPRSPLPPRITPQCCSTSTAARAAVAPSARCLQAARTSLRWLWAAANAPCIGTTKTATNFGWAEGRHSIPRS